MSNFNLYSQYYELLYQDKQTREECNYVHSLLQKYEHIGNKWLEFGAGSGRHGAIFNDSGIQWTGIERSPEMAKQARKKGLDVHVGSIQELLLGERNFDAVLSLFHVVSYLPSNEDVVLTFKNAARHLKPGGLFLFDVWYSPAVLTQLPEKRTKKVENDRLDVTRIATPTIYWNDNTINVHYDIEVKDIVTDKTEVFYEDHLMRHFSLPELKLFSQITNFEFLHAEEWLTGAEPSLATWGISCLLKKIS